MDKANKLHLYTGEGKGKTTAAMGLALRALGHERRVLVAQFIKTGTSGEIKALRTLTQAQVIEMPPVCKFTYEMTAQELEATRAEQQACVERLCAEVERIQPQLMVFDELAIAAYIGVVSEEGMWRLIGTGLRYGEVAVTGRYAPQSLLERADYVSELTKHRHPFDQGVNARKGVEF